MLFDMLYAFMAEARIRGQKEPAADKRKAEYRARRRARRKRERQARRRSRGR